MFWQQARRMARCVRMPVSPFEAHSDVQIWIWDLATPGKPFSPGTRSRNLEDITSLAWNPQHESIFATSSSSGYTVVWDLRTKREFVTLAAPQGQMGGQVGANMPQNWMAPAGGRGGSSCVAWHPETVSICLLPLMLF